MFAYEWDASTDTIIRSGECSEILGTDKVPKVTTGQQILAKVHPDDRDKLLAADAALSVENPHLQVSHRLLCPDGSVIWAERTGRAYFDKQGKMLRIVGMVANITERKEAEEALRRSESNFRMFVSQSSEGIFCQELDRPIPVSLPEDEQAHRILHESYMAECNEALARMYGLARTDFVGKRLTDTLDADDPINIQLTRDYIRGGYRVVDRESNEVDAQGNSKVFLNSMIGIVENGMLLRTWGIQRDITDRRQAEDARVRAEQALRESEQRFRLAVQAGKMYAYEWDVTNDVILRSEEHVNVLGLADHTKRLTRQQLLATVHADERALVAASVDQLSPQNPSIQMSYRMLRPDGSVAWLEKSARAFFDERGKMLRVIGMVADITERKRAEETLHESERNLAGAQARAHLGSWVENLTDHKLVWSDELYRLWGLEPRSVEPTRDLFLNGVHPDDRATVWEKLNASLENQQPFDCVHRVLRPDGTVRFAHAQGELVTNNQRWPVQFVGTILDVTEQKLAEEALASVSRRLIEAQELERTRIGRELHDDIGQRLSMLAIGLEQLENDLADSPPVFRSRVDELRMQTSQIAADLQSLSHELHSAKLEYLGISAAMRAFCKEFAEQQHVEIDIKTYDLPTPLTPDISLCFFRILQEALHNSAKHSGVRHFEVRLWGTADEIHLTVRDSGAGFDREAARQSRGLGLISMEERLKVLKGTLSIESLLQRGTTIHARIPFSPGKDSLRAAG
jgi:PAS domain S-box-containing protein